jgi:biopolymer transport protein ExbD
MITMPRRNVTRFFIPLIDVLILLFCIFLLMEFNSDSTVDLQSGDVESQAADKERLEKELQRRNQELQKFEALQPMLTELDKLRKENERMRESRKKSFQENALVHVIEIKKDKNGVSLEFFDGSRGKGPLILSDAQSVQKLIKQHLNEANGRQLYYYFLYPRTGYLSVEQEQKYLKWFQEVPNSLVKVGR